MFVKTEQQVTFTGTKTTDEERQELRGAGFVHVTGLTTYASFSGKPELHSIIGSRVKLDELGKYGQNKGITTIVTTGGEVWIAFFADLPIPQSLVKKLCPKGSGAWVQLSNGEKIEQNVLLARVANPDFNLIAKPA
jgi:hypothetical protein